MVEGRLVDQKNRHEDKQLGRKGLTRKKKKRGKGERKKGGKRGKKRIRGIDKALKSSVVGGLVGDTTTHEAQCVHQTGQRLN